MASASLRHIAFIFGRNTDNDSGRVNPDPVNYFYCRLSTARFLDIEKFAATGAIKRKRKGHTRTKTLADGTTLGGKDGQVNEGNLEIYANALGHGKNIRLVTGKKTAAGNYQTISFNFPGSTPTVIISEALGELIPPAKFNKGTPTAADIFPYFILPSGKRGAIMKQSAAVSSTDASVGLTPQLRLALISKLGAVYLAGATDE